MIVKTLGHYCITEKIGQGGTGEGFLTEDTSALSDEEEVSNEQDFPNQ
jgi:hypothetical protein